MNLKLVGISVEAKSHGSSPTNRSLGAPKYQGAISQSRTLTLMPRPPENSHLTRRFQSKTSDFDDIEIYCRDGFDIGATNVVVEDSVIRMSSANLDQIFW